MARPAVIGPRWNPLSSFGGHFERLLAETSEYTNYLVFRAYSSRSGTTGAIISLPRNWVAFALWLALVALSICASPVAAESAYRRGAAGEPATLDPQKTATVVEADVAYDLFEGLITYDADGALVPGVAESWTASADGLRYTFKLRDATWSNGAPIVAEDFVYSLRRLLDPATGAQYANLFHVLKNGEPINKGEMKIESLGVKALDSRTLEVELERPTPYILGLFAHQTAAPVNPANVEKFGKDFVRPGNLVSNGAYRLAEFTPNDRIVLTRNEKFHDAANVRIDREEFLPLEDRSAALLRFQAGEIDSYNDAPADQISFIRDRLKGQFQISPSLGVLYLSFNTKKRPFDDPRVRNALSMVVDREFLAERIWSGSMLPGYSLVPPGIDNYGPPVEPEFRDLSPIQAEDQAKSLLKAAGYGPEDKPLKVEIRFNTSENNKATAVAIAEMWKPLGVAATFVNTDLKTHFAFLRGGGDYDVARVGWVGDYSDPQNFLILAKGDNVGLNYSRYANPAYDALLAKADAERDLGARAKILGEAEAMLLRDQPIMPLLFYSSKNLISTRLSGWRPNLLDRHLARYLSIAP
jgi:oligopeptide transport system substrate-binding protein